MNKVINFTEQEVQYIMKYAQENDISNFTAALKSIIHEHEEAPKIEERIVEHIEEKYKNLFTRLRLGVTETDKNVQVILECLNAAASQFSIKPLSTEVVETELIKESTMTVKERIKRFKERKDWKKR